MFPIKKDIRLLLKADIFLISNILNLYISGSKSPD